MNNTRRNLLLALLVLAAPFALAADRERIKEITSNMICMCGCNQLLGACNHLNCPTRGPMTDEVAKMLDEGKTQEQILPAFADKYGLRVLAAPPASGFNLSAWIMPFVALAIGFIAVGYVARRWKSRSPEQAAEAQSEIDTSKYHKRLQDELDNYTPED